MRRTHALIELGVVLAVGCMPLRAVQAQAQPNCQLYTGVQQTLCLAYHRTEGQFLKNGNMTDAPNQVTESSAGNVDTWTIIDPPISTPSTAYPQIVLTGGDSVSVSAVGCGNHGGNSDTWADSMGTSGGLENLVGQANGFFPGVMEFNIPNSIGNYRDPSGQGMKSWWYLGTAVVPGNGPDGVLSLGFTDNDYHDNGYYQQYPGYFQECTGWYGFAVTVKITHNGAGSASNLGSTGNSLPTFQQQHLGTIAQLAPQQSTGTVNPTMVTSPVVGGGGSSVGALQVLGARMTVVPLVAATTCPATISFHALVGVRGIGEIAYRWVRSDGASTQIVQVPVRGPSAQLTTTWTLGVSYSGWEELQIVSPQVVHSRSRTFQLTCISNNARNAGIAGIAGNAGNAASARNAGSLGNSVSASYGVATAVKSMPDVPHAPGTSAASIVISRPAVPTGLVTCPFALRESASVVMGGAPRPVTVRWVHVGGAPVAPQRLNFNGRNPVYTTDEWLVGQPHTAVRGAFVLQAWTPQPVQSATAPFAFRCR